MLLSVLKWTEKNPASHAVKRGGKTKIWQKEIHIPNSFIAIFSLAVIFTVLLFQVGFYWPRVLGLGLFILMSFIFIVSYLHYDQKTLLEDNEGMMLFGLICICSVLLIVLFKELEWFHPMATPLAATTILIGLLLSRRLAMVSAVVFSMVIAGINDFSLEYMIIHLFGSLTGVAGLTKVRNRSDLTQLGLKVALVYVIGIVTVWFFYHWPSPRFGTLGMNIVWGCFSGFVSALIVLGILPYMELFFSRTTNIKLLELGDFNRPLLKRLMIEAPGTYHHSLIVASLAEQAAEAIGANSLLARVGAYYHDIGKLLKPEYFIENQSSLGNPHDPLAPTMSSLVVISHVKEGVALAHARNIDSVIIDCIEQHHGTSVIHYFYHRALEQKTEINPEDFRYPGPKPKNKETAILMLADSVEAASRAMEDPSPSRLKDMVEKIINNKFTDGQFTDCPITLHDLSMTAESLVTTLNGIFHARVEYKESEEQKKQKPDDQPQASESGKNGQRKESPRAV
jgi:hypothetical protein